jgi:hypothetical protein
MSHVLNVKKLAKYNEMDFLEYLKRVFGAATVFAGWVGLH